MFISFYINNVIFKKCNIKLWGIYVSRVILIDFCSKHCLKHIFSKSNEKNVMDFIIRQEGDEDFDIITKYYNGNEEKNTYQIKFNNGNELYLLNKNGKNNNNDGLTKVILCHYKDYLDKGICNIYFKIYSRDKNLTLPKKIHFLKRLLCDNDNNYLLGKYLSINYSQTNAFKYEYNKDYEYIIQNIRDKDYNEISLSIDELDDNKYKSLKDFCYFCMKESNHNHILDYFNKIHFEDVIYIDNYKNFKEGTINELNNYLPKFFECFSNFSNFSNDYKSVNSNFLYYLFQSKFNENIINNENELSLTSMINEFKNYLSSIQNDEDRINVVFNTISYFIHKSSNHNNWIDSEETELTKIMYSDFIKLLIYQGITINEFINKMINIEKKRRERQNIKKDTTEYINEELCRKKYSEEMNNIVLKFLRKMIYKHEYDFTSDKSLFNLLIRMNSKKNKPSFYSKYKIKGLKIIGDMK